MARHDRSYRKLFDHPRLVASLLGDLLGESITGPLDLSILEQVSGSFVGPGRAARYTDHTWRVRRRDGEWLYLLMEFQSTAERYMPARMLSYVALLQQNLIEGGQLAAGAKIPEILPVVIYNGPDRWGQPVEISELIAAGPLAGGHVPRLAFVLVDEGSYPVRRLARRAGPVGALFLLERCETVDHLQRGLRLLAYRLQGTDDTLRHDFLAWLENVLLPGRGFDLQEVPPDLQELKDMLAERVKVWNRELIEKGRQEGRQEGLKEGRSEGEAGLLLRQLELKFGPLGEATVARVRTARSAERRAWAERLLTAATLAEVFALSE